MPSIKVESKKRFKLAYIEHTGDYSKIPYQDDIQELYGWAKENKVRPGFYPIGIFHDPPDITSPDKLRSEVGIQVYSRGRSQGKIRVREVPAMKVATISHKGPASEYPKTYDTLRRWVQNNGYEWAGPAIEVYTRKPKIVGDETILYTKIEAPIRKK